MQLANDGYKNFSNAQNEQTEYRVGDVKKIIDLLINQYNYPIRTLVQEYISNAIDATREVQSKDRIEVQLPNSENDSTFSVRDYGPGLSPDRFKNVFTVMGCTTKDQTNDQIGGFGLGAKSALSYTDSFFVTTFHEGIRYDYLIRKGDEGGITAEEIFKGESDLPTGTEIRVKASRYDREKFVNAYHRVTAFQDKSEKPFSNLEKEPFLPEGRKISERITLYNHEEIPFSLSRHNSIVFVVGGVPYELTDETIDDYPGFKVTTKLGSRSAYCIQVPIGEVMPLQTREGLKVESKITKQAFEKYSEILETEVKAYIKSLFKSSNLKERLAEANDIRSLFYRVNVPKISCFEFNATEIYLSSEFFKLRSYHRSQKSGWGSHAKFVKNVKVERGSCWANKKSLDMTYWCDEPNRKAVRRARSYAENNPGCEVILLQATEKCRNRDFAKLVMDMGIKRISSLPEPVKKAKDRPKTEDDYKVTYHKIQAARYNWGIHSLRRKSLDTRRTYGRKCVYVPLAELKDNIEKYTEHVEYLDAWCNTLIVGLTDANIKKVKDCADFIPFTDEWLKKELEPKENHFNEYKNLIVHEKLMKNGRYGMDIGENVLFKYLDRNLKKLHGPLRKEINVLNSMYTKSDDWCDDFPKEMVEKFDQTERRKFLKQVGRIKASLRAERLLVRVANKKHNYETIKYLNQKGGQK